MKLFQTQLNFLIEISKEKYIKEKYESKLSDTGKSSKAYWPILKSFFIAKKPYFLPLFENNEYITHFKKRVELFNSCFANECSVINNDSQLPPPLSYKSNKRLSSVKITDDNILKTIAKLDPNKGHGHDKISICMIKIYSTSICKPLRLIFNHCLDNGIYSCEWKKVVPIHNKGYKQTLKNYC